jgi:hypothetical protein
MDDETEIFDTEVTAVSKRGELSLSCVVNLKFEDYKKRVQDDPHFGPVKYRDPEKFGNKVYSVASSGIYPDDTLGEMVYIIQYGVPELIRAKCVDLIRITKEEYEAKRDLK